MLAAAFEHLKNLQEISIFCEKRNREQRYAKLTATRAFSILSACLPFTEAKIQKLRFAWWMASSSRGVSLQALCMPQHVLACFSELRTLELLLRVKDGKRYRSKYLVLLLGPLNSED